VPESKYRLYKSCGDENVLLMEKLSLMRSETEKTELKLEEKLMWSLIGAGIMGLIRESR